MDITCLGALVFLKIILFLWSEEIKGQGKENGEKTIRTNSTGQFLSPLQQLHSLLLLAGRKGPVIDSHLTQLCVLHGRSLLTIFEPFRSTDVPIVSELSGRGSKLDLQRMSCFHSRPELKDESTNKEMSKSRKIWNRTQKQWMIY